MNTDLVLQFRTVFESGTIARAATALNMTPGALSRAIKRLEIDLGCTLFMPSGRNIIATKEAELFYHSSSNILQSIEAAKLSVKNIKPAKREFKISTFEVFSTHFIAWMLEQNKFDESITLFESTPGEIEEQILTGQSDLGITYIPQLHPELDHLPIADMPIGVFVQSKSITKDLPFAVPITKLGINHLQQVSLDGWPSDTYRSIQYQFEMLESALDLATRGQCKILCPKFIVKLENERLKDKYKLVEIKEGVKLPKFKVYVVKKKSQPEDQMIKKVCKSLRMVMGL